MNTPKSFKPYQVLVVRVEGNTVYGVLGDSWHDVTYDINKAAQLLQS